ncbi:MAG: MMPL family transporter, partial [Bacteroidetes bacterium]|nr:MMPL family transporter [Bacteroidota bacterium]
INILNAIGLPLILGMGIDTGVHVIHRYRIEGPGKVKTVFSTTGKAVLISSVTSFLAFGSLGFALYRGLASLGVTLAIGIAACWIATVTILPAIMSLMDDKKIDKKTDLNKNI